MNEATSPPLKTGAELRRHARYAVEVRVRIRLLDPPPSMRHITEMIATTTNISKGGLYMEIHPGSNLPGGAVGAFALWRSRLHLTLEAKSSSPIEMCAKTVWVEKQEPGKPFRNGIAVCFEKMGPEQEDILDHFIHSLGPEKRL